MFIVESETVQDLARLALERVTAEMFVFLLNLAEPREDSVHVSAAGRVGHRVLQRVELVVQHAGAATAGDRLVQHAAP